MNADDDVTRCSLAHARSVSLFIICYFFSLHILPSIAQLKCHCSRAGHTDTALVALYAIEFKFSILHTQRIHPSIAQLVERRTVVGI